MGPTRSYVSMGGVLPPDRRPERARFSDEDEGTVRTVAALFVATDGCYFGLPDVDPWDVLGDNRVRPRVTPWGFDSPLAHEVAWTWCPRRCIVPPRKGMTGFDGGREELPACRGVWPTYQPGNV